jgi:AcrR family transcriptional regulator
MKTQMQSAASTETPFKASRSRNGPKTREDLQCAILRLQNRGLNISISAVAREVGVAAPLIHNTYPDIAEEIRRIAGRATREQRDEKHSALVAERAANKALRRVIVTLKEDVDKLASINMTLAAQISVLTAIAAGDVVQISRLGSASKWGGPPTERPRNS